MWVSFPLNTTPFISSYLLTYTVFENSIRLAGYSLISGYVAEVRNDDEVEADDATSSWNKLV